jgi:hypothetical protein
MVIKQLTMRRQSILMAQVITKIQLLEFITTHQLFLRFIIPHQFIDNLTNHIEEMMIDGMMHVAIVRTVIVSIASTITEEIGARCRRVVQVRLPTLLKFFEKRC